MFAILLLLPSFSVKAQQDSILELIGKEAAVEMKDRNIKSRILKVGFTIDSLGMILFDKSEDEWKKKEIEKFNTVAIRYKSQLPSGYRFNYEFYWDDYDEDVFFVNQKWAIKNLDRSVTHYFINCEVLMDYPGGYNAFRRKLQQELLTQLDSAKMYEYDWEKPIEGVVHYDGRMEFLKTNDLVASLDLSAFKKWAPGVLNGSVAATYFSVGAKLDSAADTSNIVIGDLDYEDIADSLFNERPVFLCSNLHRALSMGDIVVSFIMKYENKLRFSPVVHKGDVRLSKELISFLRELPTAGSTLFECDTAEAFKRIYFAYSPE
ncbi:hypothetical protein GQF61_10245 [Sphingobacterium sp. DK4209]|uniref:Uncharacterized protein n=1 Tax=Sphingobacterium zhuxiongii TaxID=2662364 RepID=A0A5Q0QBI7_9SPHI|nr:MULTISPECIES: hypothetical protein [unclassified Sphingobacterium]MVZ66238.1 hypothetical protein [Sphingobacterium sp. DK4209]QGA24962.1 hypothetical protein GFH32_00880 [Sphingobacterium sp. dk4302]